MKTITIITEQVSDQSLTAALPAQGVQGYTVTRGRYTPRQSGAAEGVRAFQNRNRFSPTYRVDVIVDDDAVESVFDGISFAYGAGLFSDAEAWVSGPALALTA